MIFSRLSLLIDREPRDAAWNMAADEALTAPDIGPILRVYEWKRPSVSFGYFGEYARIVERWSGREPVRRWTGGGEVPHGEDFTYAVIVPRSDPLAHVSVGETYHLLHAALSRCLPDAQLATVDAAENPACFARPVRSDVLVDGRKVAGGAQRRGRFGLLHQGSVQGLPIPKDLPRRFASMIASEIIELEYTPALLAGIAQLVTNRYGCEAWMKRR